MGDLREHESLVRLRYNSKSKLSKLQGYKATLGKVRLVASISHYLQLAYHASDDEPRLVRQWCSADTTMSSSTTREFDGRIFYCTPIMTFCLEHGK